MPGPEVRDKHGHPISKGDHVYTNIRSGHHEGFVEDIVHTEAEAAKYKAKNPPKVVFHDQKGYLAKHNPGTLSDLSKDDPDEVGPLKRERIRK